MKKIDKYISKKYIKSFLMCLVSFLVLFILAQAFKVVGYVVSGKMTVSESGIYLLTQIPKLLIDVSPLATLIGGLISMNVMATNLELTSLKTSGISFKRIILYPVIISIFVSICIFIISDKVVPIANKKAEILKNNSSIADETISVTKEKAFLRDEKNIVYYIKKINRIERTAEKIEVIEFDEKFRKINKLFTAEKGKYDDKNKVWKFENVNIQSVGNFEKSTMEELVDTKYDSPPEKFMISMLNPKNLSISELKSEIKKYTLIGGNTSNLIYLLAKKYSFPFASIPVVLLGLALGSRHVRGGNAKHIGLTVVLGYGYYIINGMFEAFSKNDLINPFISSWIPNILFLVIGLYFVNKAER